MIDNYISPFIMMIGFPQTDGTIVIGSSMNRAFAGALDDFLGKIIGNLNNEEPRIIKPSDLNFFVSTVSASLIQQVPDAIGEDLYALFNNPVPLRSLLPVVQNYADGEGNVFAIEADIPQSTWWYNQ